LIATTVLVVGAVGWYTSRETLPRGEIRIAAGKKDGLYEQFAETLADRLRERTKRPVRVIETVGSEANVVLLRDGGAELALIQTDSLTPEGVVGIAPLFPEPLHFLVRKGRKILSIADLPGRRVALGLKGSGMRQNALAVLAHYGIPAKDLRVVDEPFAALETDPDLDAAFVTTGWMNRRLGEILTKGDFELISIADAEGLATRHPWFTAVTLPRGLYPGKTPVPAEPVRTVAVTALLVGRSDTTDRLVHEALAAVYERDLRVSFPAAMTAKAAKDYDAAVMHPAVADYHEPSAGLNRLSRALELIAKSKEAIFAVFAAAVLVFGWIQRRRERATEAADQIQKSKLEGFIGQTLEVELEQMEVTDPEELRPFLRRVTKIKQEALRELTSEEVRGDQLFAIFLSQCAALSEKIQMRMVYGRMSEAKT